MYKKLKYILLIIPLLLLASCGTNVEPNIGGNTTGNDKIDKINSTDEFSLDNSIDYKDNLAVKEEINDRQKGYNEINENKEYLSRVAQNLDVKISDLKEYIEVTRQLIVVDMKILNAVQNGFLNEKSINEKNYFYKMLREKDKTERSQILTNIEKLLKIIDDKKVFDEYYYNNLDLSNVEGLNNNTKIIFEYTNYYLSNVKYSLDIKTNINLILKSFEVLKIEKYSISESSKGFMKTPSNKYIYESTLKNLQKNILSY